MSLANELAYRSASEIALLIRRGQLSPVEVVDAFIERIEVRNPSLNAFVYTAFDEARQRAQAAERAVMQGGPLGLLHGVPTAIKDLFDFKPGWVSTFGGVRALKNNVANFYCPFAERIEQAGAILLGKTNSPVMGFRGVCDNYLFGPTCNPFNLAKNSGGSSGGSAAAVADGLLPLAEGTDGGGSIRIPAAWCGVYGLKPSWGRVPTILRPNAFGAVPFVFEGPITRTVEDAALALQAVAGYHSLDPFCLDEQVDFLAATRRSIAGWKIAYSPNFDVYPVDKTVADVVEKAAQTFAAAGAHVEEVKLGIGRHQREWSDLWCRMIMPLNIATFETFKRAGIDLLADHRADFPPQYVAWVERGYQLTVLELLRDQELRTEIYDAIQGIFANYDLLVTPTVACTAVDNGNDGNTVGPAAINGEAVDPLIGWCLTYFLNFTGHPAASIPAGLTPEGMPVGMQLIGRRYADADVLTASAVFERLRPWQESYKVCAGRE